MGSLDEYDHRRERIEQDRENSSRLAQCYASFTSTGLGSYQHPQRIAFDVTFTEKPFVSYACVLDTEGLADVTGYGDDSDDIPLPMSTGYVTGWDQDDRDFYIGCWVAVRVDLEVTTDNPQVQVEHHFTFAAIATKDIPIDYEDEVG